MFNRSKSDLQAGAAEHADADATPSAPPAPTPPAPPAAPTGQGPSIEALLQVLDHAAESGSTVDSIALQKISEEVEEQSTSLAAASNTQEEAHQLLLLAKQERERAATTAAKVIEEARKAAARLTEEAEAHAAASREQTRREATEQRAGIDAVVTELRETATRDADRIRSEAQASAMQDARKSARRYVARAAALGVRDAERHRAEMASVLDHSSEVVSAAQDTLKGFAATMADLVATMDKHLEALEIATAQAHLQRGATRSLLPISVDDQTWEESGMAEVHDGELVDLPVQFSDSEEDEHVDAESVATPDTTPDEQIGRPLGTLFRDSEQD